MIIGEYTISDIYDGDGYKLLSSPSSIVLNNEGEYEPSQITLNSKYKQGSGDYQNYSGRFKIEVGDNENWTTQYTSSSNEASKTYTLPSSIVDEGVYNFRKTGDGKSVGSKEEDVLIGGTVAWNQLYNKEYPTSRTVRGVTFTANADGTITVNGTADGTQDVYYQITEKMSLVNHKFLLMGSPSGGGTYTYRLYMDGHNTSCDVGDGKVFAQTIADKAFYIYINKTYNTAFNNVVFKPNIIDLTLMFGSTIADYIYSLEQATAGAGVAWFRKLFPKDYYEYNEGELISISGLQSHDMVGFNQWDESTAESNYIYTKAGVKTAGNNLSCGMVRVLPSTSYYLKAPRYGSVWNAVFFDAEKNGLNDAIQVTTGQSGKLFTTPSNCYYIGLNMQTADKGNICINLSWDGERDGEYEPYIKHSYALDSDLTLRGIPKLDSANQLYYDGDRYLPSGEVERRYGIVDLGTLPWGMSTNGNYFQARFSLSAKGSYSGLATVLCSKYPTTNAPENLYNGTVDKVIAVNATYISSTKSVFIRDTSYTDAASFKTAMSGVYLVYELATPTTSQAQPFSSPQTCYPDGTEEYASTSLVPVGHKTTYIPNIKTIRASLYKAGGTTTLLDQTTIPVLEGMVEQVFLVKTVPEYTLSTTSTSIPSDATWSETKPTVTEGNYLWTRQRSDFSDGSSTYSNAVCDVVITGIITDVNKNTNSITNKVWQSDITTKINQYDGSTVANIRKRVTQTEQDITGITTRVSDVESTTDDLGTRMTSAESSITQNANNINLKVSKDSVISEINASPESITISADKVNIEGATIFSTGRLSQTSLNNAYDAKGSAATAKTEAINSANSATDTKLQSYSTTSQMNTAIGTAVNNAVDDIEANAIKSTVSCYYRSTSNTTPTITKTTSIGTSNNTDNTWEYVMPVPKRNTYFFTCEKYTYMDDSVAFSTVRPLDSQTYASKWVSSSDNTYVDGGRIYTHSITTNQLATDAIKSNNYSASQNANSPYSATGTFLDLSTGNFYTPNFGIDNTYGKAYLNGEIIADSGQIGSDSTNYWEIGTKTDYNANDSAAIIGHGSSYIQSGGWMISSDRIDTRSYDSNRKYTYPLNDNTYWDFGLHVPNLTSNEVYDNNFIYIRNHENTIPTLEGNWNYLFRIDRNGGIEATGLKINGTTIQDMITAGVDGGAYLPTSGGTISGNLTVTGTISGLKTLSVNGKTYNGTADVNVGVIGAAYGGTGQSSLLNSANALLAALPNWTATPTDNTYFIRKDTAGSDTYGKATFSTLWTYIKGKINADTDLYTDKFVPKTGGEFTGAITVSDSFTADEATVGNLIVNGAGRFTNGLYGDLTGNADTATIAGKVADAGNGHEITLNYSGTNYSSTSWFAAWNGYQIGAISPANVLKTIGADKSASISDRINTTGTGNYNWVSSTNDDKLITSNTLAYWNGAYNSSTHASNLEYVKAGKLGDIVTHNASEFVTTSGNAASATKATQDGDGNTISSTYLKLSGGTLTKADGVSYTVANGEAIRANATSIIQSPIPKYLWHDVLAFSKIGTPNYYTTSNGTTWTASTLENRLFANMENWGAKDVLDSTINGSRWEWINVGLYASMVSWLVLGITYASPIAHFDVLIETSENNGSTWTMLSSATNLYYSQTPIWIKVNGTCQDSIRITIIRNSNSSDNYRLPICSMKLLTSRWGNQGKGSELEYPYTWDGDGNITAKGTFTGTFNGNATSATSATTATKLNSTRSFTIGKTAKNVDWSGAVSFSQAEISDNASTTAAGWMSKDDKLKLNGIETGAQVNTITGVKGNSESSYRTGNVNITASNIGLGNLTNDKQIKGLSSGTTSGHLVTWGSDGYTVADSGIAKGSVTTKITLSGTDYSASSNTITITKANLQSAVQDTSLVLMTSAERSKLSSIQVSEGGTIDFSGVTASAPLTATVNQTTKAVNLTHDTSGVTAGTYRSVTVNTYGHVTAGTNPTTLSGYGITDAKITSGVITLGSNTITPLTASSTLDATKLSGTASISTTGNASTATAFSSNASVTLTGDTTGTASSTKGWSITTKTDRLSTVGDNRSVATTPNDYKDKIIFQGLKSNGYIGSPSGSTYSYLVGLRGWADSSGGKSHELAFNDNGIFTRMGSTTTWDSWRKVIDSSNYTDYTVTKTGTGASGTWGISISGNATTATSATKANITTVANSIAKYSDTSGTFTDSYITIDSSGNLIIGDNDHPANIKIGAKNDNYGLMPNVNNYNQIGSSSLFWYRAYINNYHGNNSHVNNWDSDKNIGTAATSSASSTLGNVNFYNTCAAGGTQTKTKLQADSTTASNITVTLPKETGTLALTKNYQPYVHYSNSIANNDGKYYKISINSYTSWMLSFNIRLYHSYKAYDLQISGYNYGSSHWHSPSAKILGASVSDSINILFGYDSNYHLWIAIPAQSYTGIDIVSVTNGYTQVDALEGLFTIEMIDSEPTTIQETITAYRPWYRNETVSNATNATNATYATSSIYANNLLAHSGNEVTIGANNSTAGASTNDTVWFNYKDVSNGSTSNNATKLVHYYFGNRKGAVTDVQVHADSFVGNATTATKATQDGDGNTISSSYLKLSGGTMTGAINLPLDKMSINFRPNNTSYYSGLVYGTAGNEALALATKNSITSFMVVHGSDPSAWTNTTWQTASPTIQTKNNSLYVHELIPNGTTPTYNFKVNGTSYLGGNVRISDTNADTASCEMQYNRHLQCLEFIFN